MEEVSCKILKLTSDELYIDLKFMRVALSTLVFKEDERLVTLATDGEFLYYNSDKVIRLFEDNPKFLNRVYLHSVLHCLFSHLWIRGDRDAYLWGIACDIAVEHIIDSLDGESTKRVLSLTRRQIYSEFEERQIIISAATVYRYLMDTDPDRVSVLYREFFADDHALWPQEKSLSQEQISVQSKWQDIQKNTDNERKRNSGDSEDDAGEMLSYQIRAGKGRRNYRVFLKDFMVISEELKTDLDEFDLGYYMYGLTMYGDMPLIEPLETKEVDRIQDFVIVVDTSYSTNGDLVKNFLRETFRILTEGDNFFRKSRVHLIQADDRVRDDMLITGETQIDLLADEFEIIGGGNTDFRPAFAYIDELEEAGEFANLCGVLYFTDGKGIYPAKKPAYKTAFVYLDDYDETTVPVWAIRAKLDSEDFMRT